MQESLILREVTNIPLPSIRSLQKKQSVSPPQSPSSIPCPQPLSLSNLLSLSSQQVNFGLCLPGSIHQKNFSLTLQQQLPESTQLSIFILCEDESLYDDSSTLIFGVKRLGQSEYYDDYRMKVKSKRVYQFKIGVKTPMFYQYGVQCVMYVTLGDYAPKAVVLRQTIQIPELVCMKELYTESERMIKLSILQNKKKQCRVPFKLNHAMTISLIAEVLSLQPPSSLVSIAPLLDIKPKTMTLTGKGQFSLLFTMSVNQQIKQCMDKGGIYTLRRVLVLKIKDIEVVFAGGKMGTAMGAE